MYGNKKILLGATVFLVGLALVFSAGCGGAKQQAGKSDVQNVPGQVKIGAVLPLTGKESKIGTFFKAAYEFAVKQVNDKGGIFIKDYNKKLPIELIAVDDQTNQTKSVSLTERLITVDKVDALLGGYSTTLVEAQTVPAEKYKVPSVNGGGAATAIYSRGFKYIFGTMSAIELLGSTTMEFLRQQVDAGKLPKPSKVAILWENTDHGKDYVKGIEDWIAKNAGYFKIELNEPFELYGSDYTPALTKLKNAKVDIFLSDAHLPDYILMQRQYTEMKLSHKMVSYGARGPDSDARKALGPASDYIFAGVWWDKELPYPQVKEFAKSFEEFTASDGQKRKAEWYAAISYEAARALFRGIENAGSLNKDKIRQALLDLKFSDSILPGQVVDFPENGQLTNGFVIVQNKPDGKVDIIFPGNAKTGDPVAPIPGS